MTKKNTPSTEVLPAEVNATGLQLAPYEGEPMGIVSMDDIELISDSLRSPSVTEWKLPRAKLPSGDGDGGYQVNVLGNVMSTESLQGVIVGVHEPSMAWWKTLGTTTGSFPDCKSDDGLRGYGVRKIGAPADAEKAWGNCNSCKWNELGTKRMPGGGLGNGKDCKETSILLISIPGDLLPTMLAVTPGSLGNWEAHKMALTNKRLRVSDVVTRFELKSAVSTGPDGSQIGYKQITFKAVGLAPKTELHKGAVTFFGDWLKRKSVIDVTSQIAAEDTQVPA